MNARELYKKLQHESEQYFVKDDAVSLQLASMAYSASLQVSKLIPTYRPPCPSDDGKDCYIEELPIGIPPIPIRHKKGVLEIVDTDDVRLDYVDSYEYCLLGRWIKITKGVWPCERPASEN